MRVETLEGEPPGASAAYWRGLAFDTFDGRAWSITPPDRQLVPGSAEGGVGLGLDPDRYDLVQRIVREPVEAGVLFRIGDPRGIQGTIRRLERDASGGLYAASQGDERVRYTVRSLRAAARRRRAARRPRAAAAAQRRSPARARGALARGRRARGARSSSTQDSDAARARAIERYLMTHGRYTDTPPEPPADGSSPLEGFLLGGLAGHCEYFASAMVVLAREVGLPARLVNGFAGGRTNEIGGFVVVAQMDAHAWVEIHYEHAGWVRYDPTPADLRMRAEPPLSLTARIADLASAVELWWFQRVVGFDRSDQVEVLKRAWLAWHGRRSESVAPRAAAPVRVWRAVLEHREWVIGLGAAIALASSAMALLSRAPPARTRGTSGLCARAAPARAPRPDPRPTRQPRARSRSEVAASLPASAADAFATLTEAYLDERFGARDADAARALSHFEQALRAG